MIYALLEPGSRKVRYIGVTGDKIEHRVSLHWTSRHRKKTPVAEWLRTLDEPPEWHVFQEVEDDQGYAAEEYWIKMLRQIDTVDLLNVKDQHGGWSGFKHSEETRKKISDNNKGKHGSVIRGSARSDAKLTEDAVREIRASTETAPVLGKKFGVSPRTIHAVRRTCGSWKHVT